MRDGVVVEATSAADNTARGAEPSAAERYVQALAALPGAEHVAVVDVAGERVLGEWGGPPGSARAVLDRAHRAADPSHHGRREFEDVVATTGSAFHLSRLVLAGPGHPESVWVAVRINRVRGNLTWSRGVLAGLAGPAGAAARPATPAREVDRAQSETADDAPRGPHAEGAASASRAPAVVAPPPPIRAPATSQSAVPIAPPAAPKAQVALNATAAPKGPVAPTPSAGADTSTSVAVPASISVWTATREPSTTRSETGESRTAETAIPETAATLELAASELAVPAARTSPENRPDPSSGGPDQRSSFAPVMVVPPPPSPVPDDGRSEEPAPMPAPIITAPPLLSDGRGVEGEPAVGFSPEESGDGRAPDDDRPRLPLRAPGVQLVPRPPSHTAVTPTRPATSGTDATAEPSVLRRLISGLRRPS